MLVDQIKLFIIIKGWGRLDDSLDEMADELRETRVQVKSNKFCADASKGIADFNTQSMICAFTKNTDSCQVSSNRHFHAQLLFSVCFISRVTQAGHFSLRLIQTDMKLLEWL